MSRRIAALMAASVFLAACGPAAPSPSSVPPSSTAAPSGSAASAEASPSAAVALPEPGRPYDAEDILEAMRDSRRPGGVPAELQGERIASALADAIWTIDGAPWDAIIAGGSCGPTTCTVEIGGSTAGAGGEDLWVFSVEPASGRIELVTADLHAVPGGTAAELDRLARSRDADGILDRLLLTSVRWLPPPAEHRFRLAYRSGDEEESCAVDLELDAEEGRVTDLERAGC